MASSEQLATDASEVDMITDSEIKQSPMEDEKEEVPMDTVDSEGPKEISESGNTKDGAREVNTSEITSEKKVSVADGKETDLAATKEVSPKKASSSKPSDDAEAGKEVTPTKTDATKSVSPSSQNIAIVMSPSSSGDQKAQMLRFFSQEQMGSFPIHTIQLPLKSSPIVLKATTIPMPTKTVSIVAKPSTSASPVKTSTAVVVPLSSKTPSKAVSIQKSVVEVEKKDPVPSSSSSSSSRSESALRKTVKPGGVMKAKMQSARVIVVPLQITKEMIAAKQKAKLAKSDSDDAAKKAKESTSKTEISDNSEANETRVGTKGKNPAKPVKKAIVPKKTEEDESEEGGDVKPKSQSKASAKKNLDLAESENEMDEDMESESTVQDKTQKKTAGKEKVVGKAAGKEAKTEEEDKEDEVAEDEDGVEVVKIVKGKASKRPKDSEETAESGVKSLEKSKKKEKMENDSESEMEADTKSKIGKGKTAKKIKKKEEDDEEEADSEGEPKPKAKAKTSKKLQQKNESDDEAEVKQEDDDDSDVKITKKKRTKKAKDEEDGGGDSEEEPKPPVVKKTPGRPRKQKGEAATPVVKPKEEPVLSTRRSKRESNLSMKLAEWGLVPVATPKGSYSKPSTPRSPVASRPSSVSKQPKVEKSYATSKSPVVANSPIVSSDDISPPSSPGKPSSGVTVTVIKAGDPIPPVVETDSGGGGSSQPSKTSAVQKISAAEKQSAKPATEWLDKASTILGSPSLTKVAPKVTPKVPKVEKSTPVQSAKPMAKVMPEKAVAAKPVVEMKQMQNKSLMCKPIMMTKATSCNPIRIHKVTQTDVTEASRKKKTMFVPVPVPFVMPTPVATCAMPTPFPVPLPVPLPVPCFIPTSRKSIDGLMKSLQELHDQLPSDPFEVDLLTMAEAVATAHNEVPDCIIEPEEIKPAVMKVDPDIGIAATTMQHQTSGGELSEDVLEMALRMAQEMPEEGSIELEALKERMASHPEASQTSEFGSIRNGGVQHKRAAVDDRSSYKRTRVDGSGGSLAIPAAAVAFAKGLPMKDSRMKLKYSCGVRAWRQWVKEKNVELEKAAAALKVRSKLFKHEILQCSTEELNLALSLFVREVRKPTGEEYAPDSIYYLCLGIQYYLYENGRVDNIFSDVYYKGFSDTLNNLLSTFQIRLNTQGIIICRITEEHLWESRQLGAHSPYVLISTLVYLNTKYFMLNSTDAHLALTFTNVVKQFRKNGISADAKNARTAFLRYNVAAFTEANRQKGIEPPVNPSEQLENPDNPIRCPVKLYEFYLSKCPENIRNRSELFYLSPEISCLPNSPVWYSTQPISSEAMSKMLSRFQVVREIQEAFLHNMQPVFG